MASPPSSSRSSRVLAFPTGTFYIQSGIAGLVLDIETGFLKDPTKAGARVELTHKKSAKGSTDSVPSLEQQLWKVEEGYIVNVRTGYVLDIQGGKNGSIEVSHGCVVRAGSRVIQNVRKTGKDAGGQQWLNDDGVLTLASNPKFVVTIDGDATRDGTRITIQEKKAYNDKQKWIYLTGGDKTSPSPSRAESISIRPDNFPTGWFYIKSGASGLVVDIEHGYFTDPMKAGARAEMNHQKVDTGDGRHSLLELQLWRYEAGYLINRRTGFVLDIQGGTLKLAARVVQWQRKTGQEARNQHWFYESGFIANVYNSRLVLDIDGDGSKDGAKIAIGERKAAANADQQWILEEVRYQWLAAPSTPAVEEIERVVPREVPAPVAATTNVLPTSGWFYIRSLSSGHVIDVEQTLLSDPMSPNVLVNMSEQITSTSNDDYAKIESQLWRYDAGQIINRRSGLVLDCKQGVVRYGARLMQGVPKQGKEAHHQRWESVNGTLIVQGKPTFAIDIEGDGTKSGARLSLQRPKSQNNLDQQWEFQLATFEWLKFERSVTTTVKEETIVTSKVVPITAEDWFFIKSGVTGLVMDLEAGWITSPTDVGAYISMKKQRALDDADKSLLERQLWRYEDGYLINRRTGYVIDIYGRTAVVGVKLIQQHRALTEEDGKHNQLWTVVDGNIQSVHHSKLVINVESNKEGSRVQLVELKPSSKSTVNTWTMELAQTSWLKHSRVMTRSSTFDEGLEEAHVTLHSEFPSQKWFYIKSKASNLVLDVEHGFFRDHTKAGAYTELNNQKLYASSTKHALLELQLWRFEDGYIINRRTGMVLDVGEGTLKAGARLVQWTRRSTGKANQQWAVDNGFIHIKSNRNLVLDIDGDGTRDGARISLNERKEKKNLDQRWSFESVSFKWLSIERPQGETDNELLQEYEVDHNAREIVHRGAPVDCWFYLKSGISDLVLEVEHSRQISHMKSGTRVQLAHQRLRSGKHSHARLELQLWRFDDGYIINRRSGLVLTVDSVKSNASLIQASRSNAATQRWTIENGIIRLAAHKDFAIFLSYGRQGSYAYIRQVRRGEILQTWSFAEVRFSWLTLEVTVTQQPQDVDVDMEEEEEESQESVSESEITYLRKEKTQIRKLTKFSEVSYFFIRTANGYVVDIEHGFGKNHMKVGAYASVHPQTTAASASQHSLLDIQLWTLKDGYLINKRTGLALTFESDAKEGARLVQALPKNAIKWSIEGGYIFPVAHTHLALNVRDGYVVLLERTTSITWSVYEVTLSWLIFTEVILLEEELSEDYEFYEEFEEVVMRSSTVENEVIEYARTERNLIAPQESWFYLSVGNKVASIHATHLLENSAEGASIHLVAQKRFSSAERHALVELQLWKLEGSYIVNRFTGHYLTVDSNGSLILSAKQADSSRQQWQFSEDGSLSLISNSSQVVDFVEDKAILVERSASQTIWSYDSVKFNWLTTMEISSTYDVSLINREVTEYRTVYTRYIQYLTKYTVVTTHIIRTRRIVRVHSQVPLENATVVEREGTVWACHLVEAGTGVDYVMQLLLDNTKNVYYIYVQWGSTAGQLEGPYDSIEIATREFQDLFLSKTEIEWTEQTTAVSASGNWTTVDFEYDTITIQGDSVVEMGSETTSSGAIELPSSSQPLVDAFVPNANELIIYKDTEIYHTVLTQRSTGIIYVTQLLYNVETKTYYVYLRWGDNVYSLDGPYDTVEVAKSQFKTNYTQTFGVTWEQRDTVTINDWAIVHQTLGIEEEYSVYVSDDEDTEMVESDSNKVSIIRTTDTVVTDDATEETTTITRTTKANLTVSQPAVNEKTSWFRKSAAGAGILAAGALMQVDGIWKRKAQVVTTRKAAVDQLCPIAKTSYVYYDDEVYDAELTESSTGTKYVTQLIYNTENESYYVYYRWSETEYKLDGPHDTIEAAKETFQINYKESFDISWTEREVAVSDRYTYEIKTYETYEVIEEIEEVVDESEVATIITRENEVQVSESTIVNETQTTTIEEDVIVEATHDVSVVVDEDVQMQTSVLTKVDEETQNINVETVVQEVAVSEENTETKEVTITRQTGVITKPTVTKETSWFRHLASGAGAAAAGALTQVDGVWKRTVQVVTARKGHVDELCPISKTSYVYYDEEVYDSVLVEKETGVKYVTQLIYDTEKKSYFVYYRWSETDYRLDGPHETVEAAKSAFQVTYKESFDIEWTEREVAVSDKWTYQIQTYETIEEVEEVEEIIDAEEAQTIIARGGEITVGALDVTPDILVVQEDVEALEVTQEILVEQEVVGALEVTPDILVVQETPDIVMDTVIVKESGSVEQEVVGALEVTPDILVVQETPDIVMETVIVKESGSVTQPAVEKGSSWFRKALTATEAAARGVGSAATGAAGAVAIGAGVAVIGAGLATAGALHKIDGVWKRTVQVLTTRKAHVDELCPISKTS
ncbi:hypothetical protein BGZ98_010139, partial [Dissophora globulifera]